MHRSHRHPRRSAKPRGLSRAQACARWLATVPTRRGIALVAALAAGFSSGAPAYAQSPSDVANDPRAIVPPQLVESADAEYPPAARTEGRAGTVVLRLDVDEEGRVARAEVQQSAGADFDEAARTAAFRLRFVPARRGDRVIAARILHRYDFRLADAAPGLAPSVPAADTDSETSAPSDPASAAERADASAPSTESARASGASSTPPAAPTEVTVRGASESERLRRSAMAVHVIETKRAQRESADMGELLARSEGISVQRGGGLGSSMRFSLNGLTDEQVRFFLDGVPLELAGYPWGIANVPVNLVKRVEVYRGVVPIRFGADALGGAVNVVSDPDVRGTHGAASYQIGSFGTHRATAAVHTHDPNTGLFTRASGFWDRAENDYPVQVDVADSVGRLSSATVDRFHDAYGAFGANAEAGFVRRRWAKKLLVRAFVTDYSKDLQNNPVMSVPYGDATYERISAGVSARYEHTFARRFPVDAIVGHTFDQTSFRDVGTCVYDWFGRCIRQRPQPGEIEAKPHDQVVWDKTTYARLNAAFDVDSEHTLRLSLAPTYVTRTGDERRQLDPTALDPQTANRSLFSFVSGLEETSTFLDGQLENIVFVKDYLQLASAQEALIGSRTFRERQRDTHRLGVGDALRHRFFSWLYAKVSYEWATRLPSTYEMFGDGVLVVENLGLEPETSHNGNVGLTVDARKTGLGDFRVDTNGFIRAADHLIVLLGNERVFSYQNVYSARAIGIEASSGWTSPGEYLSLDGNVTYQDFRNTESEGTFAAFEGDRIPNRPYLFANGSARLLFRRLASSRDELSFVWSTRWVHEFFRSWESAGSRAYKPYVPAQLLHGAALTYVAHGDDLTVSFTGEVQNITDRRAFDFYGVQRPGRAVYFKTTMEF